MCTRVSLAVLCISLFAASAMAQTQTIWYVDDDGDSENGCTSWEDACPELQTALSLAGDGDQIWVAVGTYKPDYNAKTGQHTGDRDATFNLIGGVTIYGGFDGTENTAEDRDGRFDETVLSGDLDDNDGPDFANYDENSFHVVRAGSGTLGSVLDGFMVKAGRSNGAFPDNVGGGALLFPGNPVVRNCTFVGNWAGSGGAVRIQQCSLSHPIFEHCRFIGNRAGGPPIPGNGGAISVFGDQASLVDCTFIGNSATYGGAVGLASSSSPDFDRCVFIGNSAGQTGGVLRAISGSSPTMTNCLFAGNSAQSGSVLRNYAQCDAVLINCTLVGNMAMVGGIIVNSVDASPTLGNSIVWANNSNDIVNLEDSSITVSYTNIEGGYVGVGNIDADPLFIDPNGPDNVPGNEDDDLRLQPGSPCIDAADNTAVPEDIVTDLDGHPRFIDDLNTDDTGFGDPPIVDMGAFEFQDGCVDDSDCNDGDPCTDDDCFDEACVNTPLDCDDGDACTDDVCDFDAGGCVGIPIDCNDGDACTIDYCDPGVGCISLPYECDDGNICTDDSCDPDSDECLNIPIDCSDGNPCTEDDCDSETGCTHEDIECPKGEVCDPANGKCVEDQDPCECVNGRVTLCHMPPGNLANARTITVGCAARNKHLAHGDVCGPCEDGDG